jgi:hypothetical protein
MAGDVTQRIEFAEQFIWHCHRINNKRLRRGLLSGVVLSGPATVFPSFFNSACDELFKISVWRTRS